MRFLMIQPGNILGVGGGDLFPISRIRILFYAQHIALGDGFRYIHTWVFVLVVTRSGRGVGNRIRVTILLNDGKLDSGDVRCERIYRKMAPYTWPVFFRLALLGGVFA